MSIKTTPSLTRLGSAKRETRADGPGSKMELVPTLFYDDAGVRADVVRLGSARVQTRAVTDGERQELIPTLYWAEAGFRAG